MAPISVRTAATSRSPGGLCRARAPDLLPIGAQRIDLRPQGAQLGLLLCRALDLPATVATAVHHPHHQTHADRAREHGKRVEQLRHRILHRSKPQPCTY